MTTPKTPAGQSVKHTPGPWIAHIESKGLGGRKINVCTTDHVIALCDEDLSLAFNQAEANAKLIAAAPDLLDALQALTDFLERYPHQYPVDISGCEDMARAAIARATQ